MTDPTLNLNRFLKTFFRFALFMLLVPGVVLVLFYLNEGINYWRYRDIEVTDYASLDKKIEYGREDVTSQEMRVGAFDLVEQVTCRMTSEARTRLCMEIYLKAREKCAEKIFDDVDYSKVSVGEVKELIRQFNICRETDVL